MAPPVKATLKHSPPYLWATWLAKLLGGNNKCEYSVWFRARHKYQKFEESAANLQKWNRDHTKLMAARQKELERDGWRVMVEDENTFKLEGQTATLAGKPDLVAVKGDRVLVVDGKTGRERESDIWQVLLYLYAVPLSRKDLPKNIEGEVHYSHGDISLTLLELDDERRQKIFDLIKRVAGDTPPAKVPTRYECKACTIGAWDCPQRIGPAKTVEVADF